MIITNDKDMPYYKSKQLYNISSLTLPNVVKTEVAFSGDRAPSKGVHIKYETQENVDLSKPEIFGNPYWFTLHNGAAHYPIKASPLCAEKMKGYIIGIPVTLPCETCADHATAFIESVRPNLDYIVSGRDPLTTFFCNFHNYVNKRLGKPEVSVEDVNRMFTSPATISRMSYSF